MSVTRNRTILLRYIFPTICASLGTWQIARWNQKKKLLQELETRISSQPKALENAANDEQLMTKLKISPVSTGEQALLGPRGLGAPLFYGYTLFEKAHLPNGDLIVLNRGNLSLETAHDTSIPKLKNEVVVVLDKEERKPLFARQNSKDRILWKDWSILKDALNIPRDKPVRFFKVLKTDENSENNSVLHAHELSLDDIPNRHLEYIATWYSLSAFSLLMSFIRK